MADDAMHEQAGTIEITVNGKPEHVPTGASVRALVEKLGLGSQAVAAEVNQRLVPKSRHETHQLRAGDHVELVSLVGGG